MKFLIVFVALFAVALAAPGSDADAQTLRQVADVGPESHESEYETSNGIKEDSQGHLNNAGSDHESYVHKGSYSWTDDKTGETFTVTYIADENGFQPQGAHLPVAPQA